ncbi:hypothetical protein DAPPUDRAFT_252871 [Daphnia pulex]|uniref:Uncharacterized protein n=1 Tax=Daphnia pulex TaxID=6669 RepID=E9H3N8_DAPPU|nr:hypothetical protein DAPPUDRAFT_252871 [Daphnia pulex]|eukprot:EFX73664.1 hypothetical protein DAPPUDRAFT_252871 [Daphnia pulex]
MENTTVLSDDVELSESMVHPFLPIVRGYQRILPEGFFLSSAAGLVSRTTSDGSINKEIGKQPFQIQKKGSHQVAKYFIDLRATMGLDLYLPIPCGQYTCQNVVSCCVLHVSLHVKVGGDFSQCALPIQQAASDVSCWEDSLVDKV